VTNCLGGGLVILLCGAPGVGKTLTAESVAEKIKAPLFKMELMEDLNYDSDSDSSSDEHRNRKKRKQKPSKLSIENQFENATNWNAVLLFDECDAYLSNRSGVDAEQKLILNSK
jgi:SpoVK/Ycf46/Vps4 family AAA+-type ATPase